MELIGGELTMDVMFHLQQAFFTESEKLIVDSADFTATGFRFDSGVCGLRLRSDRGELVMLPFQGQQIWSATFDGRNLTMQSMFDQPYPTRVFLDTFGGFLQHCGITGVGGPSPEDTHPLHGELPNAPYDTAAIILGEDETGRYIGLTGQYQYTVAFSHHYVAKPLIKLYQGSTLIQIKMSITNLKKTGQELLYLAHVNFRPVDYGRLIYSAIPTPEHVRIRTSIPSHITPGPGYVEFIEELGCNPEKHHILEPTLAFDPEAVFFIDYLADDDGWAHSMQVHPAGYADYIAFKPEQLPKATRWISRTADQDAIALVEAGVTEPEGYLAEKAKGNIQILRPEEQFTCELRIGSLTKAEALLMENKIKLLVHTNAENNK
jgi:hypothetical protein